MRTPSRRGLLRTLCLAAAAAGCRRAPEAQVQVGAKTGAGQALISAAIALHLESIYGVEAVELRPSLGGTAMAHETLLARQIDLYPEYSGVALTTVLGLPPSSDAANVREQVQTNYRIQFRCEWVAPLGFANPPVLLTTKERAGPDGGATLGAAAKRKGPWRMGATREFMSRPDGLPLLMSAYKLPLAGAVQVFDSDQLYQALEIGQVTLIAGEVLDAGARNPAFIQLVDDRKAFPPQEAGIVVSLDVLDRMPGLMRSLTRLENRFPFELVARISGDLEQYEIAARKDPAAPPVDVRAFAAALLREAGL